MKGVENRRVCFEHKSGCTYLAHFRGLFLDTGMNERASLTGIAIVEECDHVMINYQVLQG